MSTGAGQVIEAAVAAISTYVLFAAVTGVAFQLLGRRVHAWPIRDRLGVGYVMPGRRTRLLIALICLALAAVLQLLYLGMVRDARYVLLAKLVLIAQVVAAARWSVYLVRLPDKRP